MSAAGIVIALVLLVILAMWIGLPLLRRDAADAPTYLDRQRERLLLYYERVLRNLHDLDEDYAMGKLSDEEYHAEREAWAQRGVLALQKLDELQESPLAAAPEADNAAIDAAIEAAVSAYRATPKT